MADRQARTVVGYTVDRASINQVIGGNKAVMQSIEDVRDILGDLNPVTQASVGMLMTRFKLVGQELRDEINIVEDLRAELLHLDDVVVEPEIRVKQTNMGGGRGISGSIDDTTRIGSQILSGLGQGEAANALGLVNDVADSFTKLNPAMIAVTGASVILTAATAAVAAEYDKTARSARNLISTQNAYFTAIVDGTTESVRAAVESRRVQVEIARLTYEELNRVVEQGYQETAQTLGVFTDAFLQLGNAGGARELRERRDEAQQAYQQETFLLGRLEAALTSGVLATNNAAEAERQLADQRAQAADAAIQTELRRVQLMRETPEQVRDYIQSLVDEQNAIVKITGSHELSADTAADYAERQLELANLIADASSNILPYAQAQAELNQIYQDAARDVEQWATRISSQTDDYFKALQKEIEARETLIEAQRAYNEALAKAAEDRLKVEIEASAKLNDILAEANDRAAEIEERGRKEREKILRDFQRSFTQAVGERDALAARQAQIAAMDRLKDQKESEDESIRQVNKAMEKQLRALDKWYNEQQMRIETALRSELAVRQAAINRAQIDLINAENAKLSIAAYGASSLRSINENMWMNINQTAVTWAANTVNSVRGILGSGGGVGGGAGGAQPIAYNVNIGAGMSAAQLRAVIQRAAGRSGGIPQ